MRKIIMKKNKKIKIILICIILFIICFLFIRSKTYEITYMLGSNEIKESYNKKSKIYKFLFKVDGKEYIFQTKHKYIHKKRLVKNIEIKEENNTVCIIPKGKKIDFYPLCYQNEELVSYQQIENKELLPSEFYKPITAQIEEYNKVKVNYLNNKKYFIWNYKGFDIIDGKKNQTITIFDQDTYNIPLSYKTDNAILIADYNDKYKFNKFYVIQSKNNKIKEINTDKELSFDSYILGSYKNKVYFMDKKNKKEYEINLKKSSINNIVSKNKGKILENEEFKEISINKLSTEEYKFKNNKYYDYQIIDQKLYLVIDDYKILISNFNIKDIIEIDNETIYYLVDDKLYAFNESMGEVLIMSYFEWNFNYKNMIYIF